jgi:glycosyltransferase involved in cell wall biosynthesis
MPMEQVAETMASIDLGVVPKRSDSFGNEAFSTKIMEFMAMGVPVLAADTRIDRYYFNKDLVQFFESGNVEDLAEKIFQLATNSERRRTLVEASSQFIELNNWDVKRHEYLDILDRLLRKPGATEGIVARESYRG